MECNKCNKCSKDVCACPEPVFSVEAMPDNPDILRFNVNGKSVWYDFAPVTKNGETATTVVVDTVNRTLNHYGEKSTQAITAKELGGILHLADIGDVGANTIDNYGVLNYRSSTDCGEGCEGASNVWRADNPIDLGSDSLDYVLGSGDKGELKSLMPPTDASKYHYLTWAAQDKAIWKPLGEISALTDDYEPVYRDKRTGELVVLKGGN